MFLGDRESQIGVGYSLLVNYVFSKAPVNFQMGYKKTNINFFNPPEDRSKYSIMILPRCEFYKQLHCPFWPLLCCVLAYGPAPAKLVLVFALLLSAMVSKYLVAACCTLI